MIESQRVYGPGGQAIANQNKRHNIAGCSINTGNYCLLWKVKPHQHPLNRQFEVILTMKESVRVLTSSV
jgi:hypothetical protein